MNDLDRRIEAFLSSPTFGVVGASNDRKKYGNKVMRVYLQNNKKVIPVNPRESKIEGINSVVSVKDLPDDVESISIITPPPITEKIVKEAILKGIKNMWMQPGAESAAAIAECEKNDINVIAGGPCILVVLDYHE